MSEYQSASRGSLRLKRVSGHKIKKKKKREKEAKKMIGNLQSNEDISKVRKMVDRRTKAEVAFERAREKRQAELIEERASMSHKERIMEFNKHLDTLTEHFDIPKVSWTK